MDPFRLWVALGPLAAYCLVLGAINMTRRPWILSGGRDLIALAVAVTGLLLVGPMELFMPEAAAVRFGGKVWLLLLSLYGLVVSFIALISRPRLIVYNTSVDELRPLLAQAASALDSEPRWAGDTLMLPHLGVQLHLDAFPSMRNVTLNASGDRQSLLGWRQLQQEMAARLRTAEVQFNPRGVSLVTFSLLLLAFCMIQTLADPQALAQGFRELLRL